MREGGARRVAEFIARKREGGRQALRVDGFEKTM